MRAWRSGCSTTSVALGMSRGAASGSSSPGFRQIAGSSRRRGPPCPESHCATRVWLLPRSIAHPAMARRLGALWPAGPDVRGARWSPSPAPLAEERRHELEVAGLTDRELELGVHHIRRDGALVVGEPCVERLERLPSLRADHSVEPHGEALRRPRREERRDAVPEVIEGRGRDREAAPGAEGTEEAEALLWGRGREDRHLDVDPTGALQIDLDQV